MVAKAWVETIRGNGQLIAGGREGLQGVMLANAMQLSAFLGQEITLPLDDELYYTELMKRVATSRHKTGVKAQFASTQGTFAGSN